MSSYETKVKECEKRMIPFLFSKQEWELLMKERWKMKCAFTNRVFDKAQPNNSHCKPTVDRLDDEGAYSPSNIVLVSEYAHRLKTNYVEGNANRDKLDNYARGIVKRIERIMESTENLKEIKEPYVKLFGNQVFEDTIIVNKEKILYKNDELNLAEEFVKFGKEIESFGVEFDLNFQQFKQLWNRKNCMLTKRNLETKSIFVLDKTKVVSKDNCFIVSKELQESLDLLVVNAKLSLKELKSLCKVLGK